MLECRAHDPLIPVLRNPDLTAEFGGADWIDVLARARDEGLLTRLESVLEERGLLERIPDKARVQLAEARTFVRRNQTDIRFEVNRVVRALRPLDVPIVLLKSAAYLLADLPPAGRRLAADLDIMVPKERLGEVERTLLAAGWRRARVTDYDERYYREWMHEIPPLWHPDRLFAVDIHHTILPVTSRFQPDEDGLFAAAVPLEDPALRVLCPADMVLHAAAHLFTEEFILPLRQLADLHDLLEHFGREVAFWKELVARARRHRLERILYYAIRYSRRVLGTDVPSETRGALETYRPSPAVRMIMDAAVDAALQPAVLGERRAGRRVAVWALYLRSHWLKMPPRLLARHLCVKAWQRWRPRLKLAFRRGEGGPQPTGLPGAR